MQVTTMNLEVQADTAQLFTKKLADRVKAAQEVLISTISKQILTIS